MSTNRKLYSLICALLVICATALMPLHVYADNTGDYIHNATGGVRIGAVYNNQTTIVFEDPTILKTVLDVAWAQQRDSTNQLVVSKIQEAANGKVNVEVQSELATPDNAELRVMPPSNGLSLKYVLHENKVYITVKTPSPLPDASFVVNFDAEIVLHVQVSNQGQPLQVTDAGIYVRNTKIDGDGLVGDIVKPIIDTFVYNVQDFEAKLNQTVFPLTDQINGQLASLSPIFAQLPVDFINLDTTVNPRTGNISLCFKLNLEEQCAFPEDSGESPVRSVIDSSVDRCSRPAVWVFDVEKGRYIALHKGDQNVEIEVNWEIPWFCGWDDNYGDQERAAGPTDPQKTVAVRVSRAPSGRRIDWQFLYWR